jgi:hypothetical protein
MTNPAMTTPNDTNADDRVDDRCVRDGCVRDGCVRDGCVLNDLRDGDGYPCLVLRCSRAIGNAWKAPLPILYEFLWLSS